MSFFGCCVRGCFGPSLDGSDSCVTCSPWYDRTADGKCRARYMWAAWTGLGLLAVVAVLLITYVVDLNLRPTTNSAGLERGLANRSGQKYRRSGPERDFWPLTTNLCQTSVGGPGLLLYFNFLAAASWRNALVCFRSSSTSLPAVPKS